MSYHSQSYIYTMRQLFWFDYFAKSFRVRYLAIYWSGMNHSWRTIQIEFSMWTCICFYATCKAFNNNAHRSSSANLLSESYCDDLLVLSVWLSVWICAAHSRKSDDEMSATCPVTSFWKSVMVLALRKKLQSRKLPINVNKLLLSEQYCTWKTKIEF